MLLSIILLFATSFSFPIVSVNTQESNNTNPIIYTYKSIDNLPLQLNVYLPRSTTYPKYPIFLAIHSGGFVKGHRDVAFTLQQLNEVLSRGWVSISIDYRLSPEAFIEEIFQDVQDAYNWVRNELVKNITVDPERIVVNGWSAGGGLALISGYKLTPRPKAVIAFYPFCADFTSTYAYNPNIPVDSSLVEAADSLRQVATGYIDPNPYSARWLLFMNALRQGKMGWLLTTSDPNEASIHILAKLASYSAIHNVDNNYPPTYLIHGLEDSLVPYEQSVELAQRLSEYNISYVLDLVPNAEHRFDRKNISNQMWSDHFLPVFDFAQFYI